MSIENNICDLDAPTCLIEINKEINFSMEFVAQTNAETVTPRVRATVSIITTDITLSEEALIGCNSIFDSAGELGCPLIAGETYTYKMDLLLESFPLPSPTNAKVEISLNSEVKETCFTFQAVI